MASQAPSSAITRYRPTILAIAGFAAVYGSYLIYTSLQNPTTPSTSKSGLHRSNAIHRSRRSRAFSSGVQIEVVRGATDFDSHVHCNYRGRTYTHDMWGSPDVAQIQQLGLPEDQVENVVFDIELVSLTTLFENFAKNGTSGLSDDIAQELGPLVIALRHHDSDQILEESHFLTGEGRYWSYSQPALNHAIERFCAQRSVEDEIRIESLAPRGQPDDSVTLTDESEPDENVEPHGGIKGLLYHIAEEEARREGYVHRGTRCDSCGSFPIRGIRWHCINCPDFDLCSKCESLGPHPKTHVFAKIKVPIPSLSQPHHVEQPYYPGRDQLWHSQSLQPTVRKRLANSTGFSESIIDAYYDQFTCMADVSFEDDPLNVRMAISYNAFNRAVTSKGTLHPLRSNLVFERMFSFYDMKGDQLIDFGEYIHSLSHLLHPKGRCNFERFLRGYDYDNDGLLSRRDFMRMFRAKYAIHEEMLRHNVAIESAEPRALGRDNSQEIIRSSQPISAAFHDADVPVGETRRFRNKPLNAFGDEEVDPRGGPLTETVLADDLANNDVKFWESLFRRYGQPSHLSDLHPDFNESLDARLQVRESYTGNEFLELNHKTLADRDRFLVHVDTRGTRPFHSNDIDLETAWEVDINDSTDDEYHEDARSDIMTELDRSQTLRDNLRRGRAFECSEAEKDFGYDVLFQVVEESFNELLDPIFKIDEEISFHVQMTQDDRRKYRQQIDEIKTTQEALRCELANGSKHDPLLAVADSSYRNGHRPNISRSSLAGALIQKIRHTMLDSYGQMDGQARRSAFEDAVQRHSPRNSETQFPLAPSTATQEIQSDAQALMNGTGNAPGISTSSGQQDSMLTDPASLGGLEFEPRERSSEDLASAGTSPTDRSIEQPTQVDGSSEQASSPRPEAANSDQPTDPTMPQNRPNSTPFSMPISTPVTRAPTPDSSPAPRFFYPESPNPNGARAFNSERLGFDLYMEYLARIDDAEREILERGAPGRKTFAEIEEILVQDDEAWRQTVRAVGIVDDVEVAKQQGRLRGLVGSWLEWAIF